MTPPPRPRSRRGEGELLRDEILAAAQNLLLETASEEAVSIRAVADAVGVTPPSIYRHFADKDRLLLEVCRESFTAFYDQLAEAATDADVVNRMADLGRAYIRYAVDHPEHYRIMFMSRFDLSAQDYAEEMITEGNAFELLLATSAELIAEGRVRPEVAAEGALHVGILFWASVHGLASLMVAKPGLPWPDRGQLVDQQLLSTLRGLIVEDA